MNDFIKVGFFQYNVIWRDREANLSYIHSKIKDSTFDLLVLPELFTSGYAFESRNELIPFAENLEDSYTVKFLSGLMKDCGGYITGSIPELCNEKLYNTSIIIGAEGLVASYRKIHLPDYEKRAFTAGNEAVIYDCSGIPIRAFENQCFYVSCNRIGTELFNGDPDSYCGESQIVSPDGKILVKAGSEESLTIIDVDLSEVNKPAFGSLITKDFLSEHKKYNIMINADT